MRLSIILAFAAQVLVGFAPAGTCAGSEFHVKPFSNGARVAFYGDSITRNGGGVLRVAAHYRKAFPDRDVRFFNCGISGGGLMSAEMYFDSVLAKRRPTHIVFAFGINDAFVMFDSRLKDESKERERLARELAVFRKRYAALVNRMKALGAKIILRVPTPYNSIGTGPVSAWARLRAAAAPREFSFGFKFVDSTVPCSDPIDWYDHGVVEPLGRIEFRYKGKDI